MKRLNSYKYNVLLVKDDVGVSKPSTRRLPSCNFTFGKAERRDAEGAAKGRFHFSSCSQRWIHLVFLVSVTSIWQYSREHPLAV